MRCVLLSLVVAALSGCAIYKSGEGIVRIETRVKEDSASRCVSNAVLKVVRPVLSCDAYGNFVFQMVAEGTFDQCSDLEVKEVDIHNEWTSVGLFPGSESMWKGFGGRGPIVGRYRCFDVCDGCGYIPVTGQIFANVLLLGTPTLCSLLVEPFLGYAERDNRRLGEGGLLGVYRYQGTEYEIERSSKKEHRNVKAGRIPLEGYDVMIGGRHYHVSGDGVVCIPGDRFIGSTVRVALAGVPTYPRGVDLKPYVDVEYVVKVPKLEKKR